MNTKAINKLARIVSVVEVIAFILRVCFWDSHILEWVFVICFCSRVILNSIYRFLNKKNAQDA